MLTVVIPVHNGENYIERAIKSANKNKKYETEIIVINDASTDGTQCKLNEIAKNIPIKIFKLSQNMGVGYCRNLGIKKSNGKYIAFLDSDDFVSSDMYDKMILKAEKESADICICNYNEIINGKKIKSKFIYENIKETSKDNIIKFMLEDKISLAVWDKIFLKEKICGTLFNEKQKIGEDILFSLNVIRNTTKVVFENENLYNYVQNEMSVMHKPSRNMVELSKIVDYMDKKQYEFYKENYEYEFEIFKKIYILKAIHAISNCSDKYKKEKKEYLKEIYDKETFNSILKEKKIDKTIKLEIWILETFGIKAHLFLYPIYKNIKKIMRSK